MKYVVFIKDDYEGVSLHHKTIYRVENTNLAKAGYISVVDEEGESYLYPEEYFVEIKLDESIEKLIDFKVN
ncbi:MAG: hypothetical protein Kapaf2KO_22410 [Candidatus Kapaibacteriales bacterium]